MAREWQYISPDFSCAPRSNTDDFLDPLFAPPATAQDTIAFAAAPPAASAGHATWAGMGRTVASSWSAHRFADSALARPGATATGRSASLAGERTGHRRYAHITTLRTLEDRQIPYLFKLKLTKNVKRYLEQVFWGGYMTHDIKRCRLTADAVALIDNWWSLFVRLANPDARLEAITSRPFLLSGVARKTEHAGQQHLKITPLHGKHSKHSKARDTLTRVSALMHD